MCSIARSFEVGCVRLKSFVAPLFDRSIRVIDCCTSWKMLRSRKPVKKKI
jgi:hypothetical protein